MHTSHSVQVRKGRYAAHYPHARTPPFESHLKPSRLCFRNTSQNQRVGPHARPEPHGGTLVLVASPTRKEVVPPTAAIAPEGFHQSALLQDSIYVQRSSLMTNTCFAKSRLRIWLSPCRSLLVRRQNERLVYVCRLSPHPGRGFFGASQGHGYDRSVAKVQGSVRGVLQVLQLTHAQAMIYFDGSCTPSVMEI